MNNIEKKEKFILYNSISSIIEELEQKKIINEKNYTEKKIRSLFFQGKSDTFIKSILLNKGVNNILIQKTLDIFEKNNPDWKLESAKIFARKKRLGIKYSNNLEKDLAKMARAGFNYRISLKVLE